MFRSLFRADGGDDRSPWGDFWFEPVSMRSAAGVRVNGDAAMRLSAVYACVRVLSETMASLPFVLYRKKAGGGKEPVTDHWLYRLMAKQPNRWQDAFQWREMMQGHLTLRGNGYNRIISNSRGAITELVPMHPDRVKVQLLPTGNYRYIVKQRDGSDEILPPGEVFHLRGLSSDGLVGMNPIEISRETVGIGLAAQEFGARFFANDARPLGGWIEWPGKFKDNDAKKAFTESYAAAQGGENRGKTAVFEQGMKYHEIGLNNRDSQFVEVQQFGVSAIARIFRVPPHLIGDLSKATFSNIEQQSLEFVNFTMTPWAERWEAALENQLLPEDDDLEIEFDFANLLRGDAKARAEYYSKGILDGWMTRNEARASENLNPIDGLDEPLVPLNMVEADDMPDPDADPEAAPSAPPDAAPALLPSRAEQLEALAAVRVVRKEVLAMRRNYEKFISTEKRWRDEAASFYASHAAFVAETLAMPEAAAKAYCGTQLAELMAATDDEIATGHARIPAVLDSWESARSDELVLIARGERLTPSATPAVHVHVPVTHIHDALKAEGAAILKGNARGVELLETVAAGLTVAIENTAALQAGQAALEAAVGAVGESVQTSTQALGEIVAAPRITTLLHGEDGEPFASRSTVELKRKG